MSRIYVAVDLETTGTSPDRDAILEVGLVKFRLPPADDTPFIVDRWSSLVHSGRSIPLRVSRLTSIQDSDVVGAPRLAQLAEPIRAFVGNYPVVGHNVAFDLGFLQKQGLLVGQATLDTFELASLLLPGAPRYSLGELARYLDIPFSNWHRAEADAEMAAHLLHALWQRTVALTPATLGSIAMMAEQSGWPLKSFFAAARRAQAEQPSVPTALPPHPRRQPPAAPRRGDSALERRTPPTTTSAAELEALLGSDGSVGTALPHYEARPQQVEMLRAIHRAFTHSRHLIVEAGTGTGKSLAYLLPAIFHALGHGERVVISTHTLNLQDQLFFDELARLNEALPQPFTVVRLKGRTNYLCARRLGVLRARDDLTPSEARLLARVLVWQENEGSGDRSELLIQRDEEEAWAKICADGSTCSPERCSPHGPCYWQDGRALAESAHLLIVNHALLLTDLFSGGGLIPPYRYLIVDEAHHLEEQATQASGATPSTTQLHAALNHLAHERNGRAVGLLARLRHAARADTRRDLTRLAERSGLLTREVEKVRQAATYWFDLLDEFSSEHLRGESRHRIQDRWRGTSEWPMVEEATERLLDELHLLDEALDPLDQSLRAVAADDPEHWQEPSDELGRTRSDLTTLRDEIRRILLRPAPNDIVWLEWSATEPRTLTLSRAPCTVADELNVALFQSKHCVVMTSATLSVEGSFAFLRERLGIGECDELSVGTPFNVADQALVYLVEDLPEPNQPAYGTGMHRALTDLARATQGRMLALFTSKSQMSAAYYAISEPLAQEGIVVLGQYMDGSRTQLLDRFRGMERAVLLGTLSFWEGIDIPGEALSCVAITRLPFPVPTDPIQEARGESYDNAFHEYSVPQAVLRFRQGVGRLLRRSTDRGVVALLDSRLATKSYGQTFLHSLPTDAIEYGPARQLYPMAERWLAES